jgi:hypothetical protein
MEERILMCFRCTDIEPRAFSVVDTCARCGVAVWRALTSPECDAVICMPCARAEFDENCTIEPPTPEQWAEVRRALKDET